jgi:hypothetical protein
VGGSRSWEGVGSRGRQQVVVGNTKVKRSSGRVHQCSHSLSPSRFSDGAFDRFCEAEAEARNEDGVAADSLPIILGENSSKESNLPDSRSGGRLAPKLRVTALTTALENESLKLTNLSELSFIAFNPCRKRKRPLSNQDSNATRQLYKAVEALYVRNTILEDAIAESKLVESGGRRCPIRRHKGPLTKPTFTKTSHDVWLFRYGLFSTMYTTGYPSRTYQEHSWRRAQVCQGNH